MKRSLRTIFPLGFAGILALVGIVLAVDEGNVQWIDQSVVCGVVSSLRFWESRTHGSYLSGAIVQMDDGRKVEARTMAFPVVKGSRVKLQMGQTQLLGHRKFRIVEIMKTGEPTSAVDVANPAPEK